MKMRRIRVIVLLTYGFWLTTVDTTEGTSERIRHNHGENKTGSGEVTDRSDVRSTKEDATVVTTADSFTSSQPRPTDSGIDGPVSDEKRLILALLARYERLGSDGRPVRNTSTPVSVMFGLGLIKMELLERQNMLSMSTWTRYKWKDEYLTWDPAEYGGVGMVKLSHERIWLPDIMLYNTANTEESLRKAMAVVMYDGTVTWFPHKVFQSSCAVDVRNFPFDNQTCHMWFGSWTHPLSEIDLDLAFPGGIDLSTFKSVYKDSSEWEIVNSTAERMIMPPEGEGQYAILTFTLSLKRKMMFSTYILTMPAIFLSFLTLLVFWLPPEHADKSALGSPADKNSLGLTIFGSLLLLLLILVEAAPPTASAVPLLGVYYCFTTVIVILSIFLSSVVLKVGRAGYGRKPIPKWVRVCVLDILSRLVCLKMCPLTCCCKCKRGHRVPAGNCTNHLDHSLRDDVDKDMLESCDPGVIVREMYEDTTRLNGSATTPSGMYLLDRRLRSLQALIREIVEKQNKKESKQKAEFDIMIQWRNVAAVLDRLFFISYLTVIIISLVLLFPRSPLEPQDE